MNVYVVVITGGNRELPEVHVFETVDALGDFHTNFLRQYYQGDFFTDSSEAVEVDMNTWDFEELFDLWEMEQENNLQKDDTQFTVHFVGVE